MARVTAITSSSPSHAAKRRTNGLIVTYKGRISGDQNQLTAEFSPGDVRAELSNATASPSTPDPGNCLGCALKLLPIR